MFDTEEHTYYRSQVRTHTSTMLLNHGIINALIITHSQRLLRNYTVYYSIYNLHPSQSPESSTQRKLIVKQYGLRACKASYFLSFRFSLGDHSSSKCEPLSIKRDVKHFGDLQCHLRHLQSRNQGIIDYVQTKCTAERGDFTAAILHISDMSSNSFIGYTRDTAFMDITNARKFSSTAGDVRDSGARGSVGLEKEDRS
ncbi:hypothetical protein BDY19DRAFT_908088 [Irpex rosettiformis]|uniref:Uncharacterized protein n=1 Tax=Irpex rosettiformis TaxID=378272 RepID=A0ACB8TXD6_9APHY|nr:hypothetical protein BDY19DRAFT_908088 [Irpex rosettiformis]